MIPGILTFPCFASAQGLTAAASPSYLSATATPGGTGTATTTGTTVAVSGGTPPYTHSWASSLGSGITINSPTSATTKFHEALTLGQTDQDTFIDTVTDANGVVAHASCDVFLMRADY
jgi:hypothetical protein